MQVPNLLKQAGNGIACTLRVLFHLYASSSSTAVSLPPVDGGAEKDGESDANQTDTQALAGT